MFEASPWGSAMNDEISDVNSAWLMDLQQATKPEESRLDSGQSAAGCDINSDGICDANDIDAMSLSVMDGAHSSQDRIALIEGSAPNGFHTYVGDSNLNGVFDEQDLVSAFIEGKYLTGERAGWAQGDFDGDLSFTEQDFIFAFIEGDYLRPAREETKWALFSESVGTTNSDQHGMQNVNDLRTPNENAATPETCPADLNRNDDANPDEVLQGDSGGPLVKEPAHLNRNDDANPDEVLQGDSGGPLVKEIAEIDQLPNPETLKELKEIHMLLQNLEEVLKFPELKNGAPGQSSPMTVEQLQDRLMGHQTTLEDILFGQQGPKWNGHEFEMNPPSKHPATEPGPSGEAAPNIRPSKDSHDDPLDWHGNGGEVTREGIETVVERMSEDAEPYQGATSVLLTAIITLTVRNPRVALAITSLLQQGDNADSDNPPPSNDSEDSPTPPDDRQPNPEDEGSGGPFNTLDWLAGRPPSLNPATAPKLDTLDILGQPSSDESRTTEANPLRFARMRDDINPATMQSETDGEETGGGSDGCPIGPDPEDPANPIGPSGPNPVK
ncbi:MAG: hypothetical protein CMJ80_17920 [Planctomycetaceae bacterium]|nr:hypothetical protein [Planctomycetaceae bacterium]